MPPPPPQLPTPGPAFARKKATILSQLAVPDADYTDASPKGSVDEGIRALLGALNARAGLVTTSSCAGRVSVYLEGRKKSAAATTEGARQDEEEGDGILHVLTASHEHAQLVIQAGMAAGFRETGAVSLLAKEEAAMPMVAVRSMGLSFESLVGVEREGTGRRCIVSDEYLCVIVRIANERFAENAKRIARLEAALDQAFAPPKGLEGWEDAETRRERKRVEGLRRRWELKRQQQVKHEEGSKLDLGVVLQAPDIM
ncbi:hypothetical protein QBC39DRAFT_268624 [Podospora conica]|nr:hypothetical protein QBC39DRAFT_268624 [Schizothecium conicum]